jgi:hypothetical protein
MLPLVKVVFKKWKSILHTGVKNQGAFSLVNENIRAYENRLIIYFKMFCACLPCPKSWI